MHGDTDLELRLRRDRERARTRARTRACGSCRRGDGPPSLRADPDRPRRTAGHRAPDACPVPPPGGPPPPPPPSRGPPPPPAPPCPPRTAQPLSGDLPTARPPPPDPQCPAGCAPTSLRTGHSFLPRSASPCSPTSHSCTRFLEPARSESLVTTRIAYLPVAPGPGGHLGGELRLNRSEVQPLPNPRKPHPDLCPCEVGGGVRWGGGGPAPRGSTSPPRAPHRQHRCPPTVPGEGAPWSTCKRSRCQFYALPRAEGADHGPPRYGE